jgi:hypothetical protein
MGTPNKYRSNCNPICRCIILTLSGIAYHSCITLTFSHQTVADGPFASLWLIVVRLTTLMTVHRQDHRQLYGIIMRPVIIVDIVNIII